METIKSKHLARRHDLKRQATTTAVPVNNVEQKDFLNSLFTSGSPNSIGLLPSMDNNNHNPTGTTSIPSPLSSLFSISNEQQSTQFYPHQRNSSQQFDPGQNQLYDELLPPPPSYPPIQNNSYMNMSYPGPTHDSTSSSSPSLPFINHHPYPF